MSDPQDIEVTGEAHPEQHTDVSTPLLSRRKLLRQGGKALYLAPTLTVLSAVHDEAQADLGCPPNPPAGSFTCP